MKENERERLQQIRTIEKEKFEKINKSKKTKKIIIIIIIALLLLFIAFLAYLYLTKDARMEKKFVNEINVIYSKLLEENEKKKNDPYYEYFGINAENRETLYKESYEQIEQMILSDINEAYYILEENELNKLGINQVEGPFLVNYEKSLVFSITPLVLKYKTLYTSPEILNNYEVEKEVDNSGANAPELYEGMKPIIYNEDTQSWEFVNNQEQVWYNYTNKKWANIMLSDYEENEENGSMFVWVPRFAYKIAEKNYHNNKSGIIDIKFLVGNTNTTSDGIQINPNNTDCVSDYVVHPAFNFGEEITGIWVSKFEASSAENGITGEEYGGGDDINKTYKSMFDMFSWRNTTISTAYTVCRNMINNNVYGLDNQQADTHLIKNSEWGAVSYLTQSKYGRNNNEVWNNNYLEKETDSTKTGYAGRNSKDILYGTDNTFEWNSQNGIKASTTGNVYGIYDMSGGCMERTAAYIDNRSESLINEGKALYEETNLKYKDVYKVGNSDDETENYKASKNMIGDAIYETALNGTGSLAWFSSYSIMPCNQYPFFYRGGNAKRGEQTGLFAFSKSSGGIYALTGFRAVITKNTD